MLGRHRLLTVGTPLLLTSLLFGMIVLVLQNEDTAVASPQAQATATFRPTRTPLPATPTGEPEETLTGTQQITGTPTVEAVTPTLEITPTGTVTATPAVTSTEALTAPVTPTATALAPIFTFTQTVDITTERTLTVRGVGQATADPDQAHVRVGFSTQSSSPREAVDETNDQMEEIIAALQEAGVDEGDIQTTQFNIFARRPEPRPETEPAEEIQYEVIQEVSVLIRDIDNAGEILQTAIDAGANRLSDLRFSISDTSPLERQARVAAMTDAYRRAQDFAALADVELAGVITINERAGGGAPRFVEEVAFGAGDAEAVVRPGQLSVTSEVEVTFAVVVEF